MIMFKHHSHSWKEHYMAVSTFIMHVTTCCVARLVIAPLKSNLILYETSFFEKVRSLYSQTLWIAWIKYEDVHVLVLLAFWLAVSFTCLMFFLGVLMFPYILVNSLHTFHLSYFSLFFMAIITQYWYIDIDILAIVSDTIGKLSKFAHPVVF